MLEFYVTLNTQKCYWKESFMSLYRIFSVLFFVLFYSAVALAGKKEFKTWDVDVRFYNASKEHTEAEIERRVAKMVAFAEASYSRKPALKINYSIHSMFEKGGKDLTTLSFESGKKYAKFMDKYFDNVAKSKTNGYMRVLITDEICIKGKCIGGRANFPHDVTPFKRKYGIILDSNNHYSTYSHELGHFFGLKHTFEPYLGTSKRCNKGTKKNLLKLDKNHCNSCSSDLDSEGACLGRVNVMDYCSARNEQESNYIFNNCQKDKSAKQRRQYLTKEGKVNYSKLKGGR